MTCTTGATDPLPLPHCPVPPFSQLAIKPDLLLRLRWRCCRMDEPGGCWCPPTPPHPPPEGLRPAPLQVAPPTSGQPPPSKLRIVEKFARSGSSGGGGARLVLPFWCFSPECLSGAFRPHQSFSTGSLLHCTSTTSWVWASLDWAAPELASCLPTRHDHQYLVVVTF